MGVDNESSVSPSAHSGCPLAHHVSSRSPSFVPPLELVNHNSRSLSPSKSSEYSLSHPNSDWTTPSGFASQHESEVRRKLKVTFSTTQDVWNRTVEFEASHSEPSEMTDHFETTDMDST